MKNALHSSLKALYLLLISSTLPLALVSLAPAFAANEALGMILLVSTYLYACLWLMFFMLLPMNDFPETIGGAIQTVGAPLLNLAGIYFLYTPVGGTFFSTVTSSSAAYFQSTTLALFFLSAAMLKKGFDENAPRATKYAVLFLMGMTGGYAALINFNVGTHWVMLVVSAGLASFPFIRQMYTPDAASHKTTKDSPREKNKNDVWGTVTVIALVLSAFASVVVAGMMG